MKTDTEQPQRKADGGEGRALSARYVLVGALGVGALFSWRFESQTHTVIAAGVTSVLVWSLLVGVTHILYQRRELVSRQPSEAAKGAWLSFPYFGQALLLAFGVVLLINICGPTLRYPANLGLASAPVLQTAAAELLIFAILLSFLVQYAQFLGDGSPKQFGRPVIQLSRLAAIATGLASMLLFLFLATGWDFGGYLGLISVAATLILIIESAARMCSRFFQPVSLRRTPGPLGRSALLDLLGGSSAGWRRVVAELEDLLGTKLSEIWILGFLRQAAGSALLGLALLGWLSTCLTAVPLGSRGVLETMGRFNATPLPPGLHLTLPWPVQKIDIVPTQSVQEVSLGFEQDLSGPLLWTERHYVGEHNLLIDGGESLLVIDAPVEFRIADPVAYLQASSDPVTALRSLAERELIRLTQGEAGFDIMTQNRPVIAARLKAAVQADADRLGLGIEIVFVGLKDVHPPVDVAPAYEKVVSAEESEAATIDQAKAYAASQIPDAQAQALRLTSEAAADATRRVDLATGEAASFAALVSARAESPALLGLRLRYDALRDSLPNAAKFVVGLSSPAKLGSFLNLRALGLSAGNASVPAPQAEPPPLSARTLPAEVPEH